MASKPETFCVFFFVFFFPWGTGDCGGVRQWGVEFDTFPVETMYCVKYGAKL